jgi:hypothetical protein
MLWKLQSSFKHLILHLVTNSSLNIQIVSTDDGLLISRDDGESWTKVEDIDHPIKGLGGINNTGVVMAVAANTIFTSINFGGTWESHELITELMEGTDSYIVEFVDGEVIVDDDGNISAYARIMDTSTSQFDFRHVYTQNLGKTWTFLHNTKLKLWTRAYGSGVISTIEESFLKQYRVGESEPFFSKILPVDLQDPGSIIAMTSNSKGTIHYFLTSSYQVWRFKNDDFQSPDSTFNTIPFDVVMLKTNASGNFVSVLGVHEIMTSLEFTNWQTSLTGREKFEFKNIYMSSQMHPDRPLPLNMLVTSDTATLSACPEDVCVNIKGPCHPNDLRRIFRAGCGDIIGCPADTSFFTRESAPTSGGLSKLLQPRWREGDRCSQGCKEPNGLDIIGCTLQRNHGTVCEQNERSDTKNQAVELACAMGGEFTNNKQFCCTEELCEKNKVQFGTEFINKCLENRDTSPQCAYPSGRTTEETTELPKNYMWNKCNENVRDFCRQNNDENMSIEECQTYADMVNIHPGGEWADQAMFNYCQNHKEDPRCACFNSTLPLPACLDSDCATSGYQTKSMKERECPGMCAQIIQVNETGGNVDLDNNTFVQMCSFGGNTPENLITWFECREVDGVKKCRRKGFDDSWQAPPEEFQKYMQNKPKGSEQYRDDPSCGGNCNQVMYKCGEDFSCVEAEDGEHVENTCNGECQLFACKNNKCVLDKDGEYRSPTCNGTCAQVNPDRYFKCLNGQCRVSHIGDGVKNNENCCSVENSNNMWMWIGIGAGGFVLLCIIIAVILALKKKQKI